MAKRQFEIGDSFVKNSKDLKRADIMDRLDSVAYRQKDGVYTRVLTEEEIQDSKSKLSESCIKLANIEEEKKEIMDGFKERIKEEKVVQKEFLDRVKYGSVNVEGRLFEIDNQEEGIMYIFDDRGICVQTRGLLPEERQGKIRMMNKASGE